MLALKAVKRVSIKSSKMKIQYKNMNNRSHKRVITRIDKMHKSTITRCSVQRLESSWLGTEVN